MTGSQQLTFDGIELLDVDGSGDDGYLIEAVEGTRYGNPVPVEATISSFLRDGSIVSKTGDENREMTILVRITAPDGVALALGEKRLNLATGKRTTLSWTPPDGIGKTTVFDVLTSSLGRVEDEWDYDETRGVRTYSLRLVCLPFGRSVGSFVDVATSPPAGSAGTVFYTAESTTGWSAYDAQTGDQAASFTVNGTYFVEGTGSIKGTLARWDPGSSGATYTESNGAGGTQTVFTYNNNGGTARHQITGLSAVTGTGGYISVAIRLGGARYDASRLSRLWQMVTPGVWTEVLAFAAVGIEANSFVRYRWPVAAGLTITGFRFETTHGTISRQFGVPQPDIHYDDFRLLPTASTDQQIIKVVPVEGSARTTGSLHIGSGTETVGLGQVLVATVPTSEVAEGFNPSGRTWVTQGTVTADATALGGGYYSPDAATYSTAAGKPIFNIPNGLLVPGAYTMVTLVKTSAGTVTSGVQAQLNVNGTQVGVLSAPAEVTTVSTTTDWQFVVVGTLQLPPTPVQNADSTTTVRLTFKGASLANVYMIPAWPVEGRPAADYTIVDCGSGTASPSGSSSHLWLDSPSLDQPRGGIWRGPTADRLNTRSAWDVTKKPGTHTFRPGSLSAFLVSTASFGPTLELEYTPAWFGSAAL